MVVGIIGFAATGGSPSLQSIPIVLLVVVGVLALAGIVGFLFLNIGWFFTLPLIADKRMNFWPAMSLGRRVVNKHWWGTFWLTVVVGLLGMAGVLLCGIGLLVTGPVAMGMLTAHYQNVFGDLQSGVE
jgi:uncharacterized membrane protein